MTANDRSHAVGQKLTRLRHQYCEDPRSNSGDSAPVRGVENGVTVGRGFSGRQAQRVREVVRRTEEEVRLEH